MNIFIRDAILRVLENGPEANGNIFVKLKHEGVLGPFQTRSMFDKYIQQMRVEGLISHRGNKWYSSKLTKCDKCDGKGYVYIPGNSSV